MKIYLVGGAVRDQLLGRPVKERDWVVVGATVSEMLRLGYRQVGKEFPVFLHPKTNEEYALARLERKATPGYTGFDFDTSPTVTLEQDLQRRDLTINAMAQTVEGQLIDPYHGKQDLGQRILRHVSAAFAEDPVRILRVGRFLARYAPLGFTVATETIDLMHAMVTSGEVDALVAERIWKELERALGEPAPEQFFAVLAACQALPKLFPGITIDGPGIRALTAAVHLSQQTTIRLAALLHALPHTAITTLCRRYRLPNRYRQLTTLVARYGQTAASAQTLSAHALLQLLSALDIFRRKARFHDFLLACQAIADSQQQPFAREWLLGAAQAAQSIDVQIWLAQGLTGPLLATKLLEEREKKIAEYCHSTLS